MSAAIHCRAMAAYVAITVQLPGLLGRVLIIMNNIYQSMIVVLSPLQARGSMQFWSTK